MNFRLGQKVLKDCGIHFCLFIVSISTHQCLLRLVASCQQRGSDVTLFPSGGP